jgi:hypothetical protein
VNTGRILVRALIVIGGAAAVCAIAWLTATASASPVTQVTDGLIRSGIPTAATPSGDPQLPVLSQVTSSAPLVRPARDAATPVLARVRDLSGAAAHTGRLVDLLDTNLTQAMATIPATVLMVRRVAESATDPTGPVTPTEDPSGNVEHSPPGLAAARPNYPADTLMTSGPRERSTGLSPVAIPVGAAKRAVAGELRTVLRSEYGAGGLAGGSWLSSCVIPASAGFTSGHDHTCGDVVQSLAAKFPQASHRRNGALRRAVTSTEMQPGVTPD